MPPYRQCSLRHACERPSGYHSLCRRGFALSNAKPYRRGLSSQDKIISKTRDLSINIRVSQDQRDLIDRAAALQGKSRSEFMLESAYQKARDTLLDRSFFGVDQLQFQQFTALLDAPISPNEKLHRLLTNKAPWE